MAHTLLDVQIQKTAFSPAIASHPFANSGISALRNEDSILSSGYAIYHIRGKLFVRSGKTLAWIKVRKFNIQVAHKCGHSI